MQNIQQILGKFIAAHPNSDLGAGELRNALQDKSEDVQLRLLQNWLNRAARTTKDDSAGQKLRREIALELAKSDPQIKSLIEANADNAQEEMVSKAMLSLYAPTGIASAKHQDGHLVAAKDFIAGKFAILSKKGNHYLMASASNWSKVVGSEQLFSLYEAAILEQESIASSLPADKEAREFLQVCFDKSLLQGADALVQKRKERLAALMLDAPADKGRPAMQAFWQEYTRLYQGKTSKEIPSTHMNPSINMGRFFAPIDDADTHITVLKKIHIYEGITATESERVESVEKKEINFSAIQEMIARDESKVKQARLENFIAAFEAQVKPVPKLPDDFESLPPTRQKAEITSRDEKLKTQQAQIKEFLLHRADMDKAGGYTHDLYSAENLFCAGLALNLVDFSQTHPGPREQFWKLLYPQLQGVFLGDSDSDWPDYGEAVLSDTGLLINYRKIALMAQYGDVRNILMQDSSEEVAPGDPILVNVLLSHPQYRMLSSDDKEHIRHFNQRKTIYEDPQTGKQIEAAPDYDFWNPRDQKNLVFKNYYDFFQAMNQVFFRFNAHLLGKTQYADDVKEGEQAIAPFIRIFNQPGFVSRLLGALNTIPPPSPSVVKQIKQIIGVRTTYQDCFGTANSVVDQPLNGEYKFNSANHIIRNADGTPTRANPPDPELVKLLTDLPLIVERIYPWQNTVIQGRDNRPAVYSQHTAEYIAQVENPLVLFDLIVQKDKLGISIETLARRFFDIATKSLSIKEIFNLLHQFPKDLQALEPDVNGRIIDPRDQFIDALFPDGIPAQLLVMPEDYYFAIKLHHDFHVKNISKTLKGAVKNIQDKMPTLRVRNESDSSLFAYIIPLISTLLNASAQFENGIKDLGFLSEIVLPHTSNKKLAVFFGLIEDVKKVLPLFKEQLKQDFSYDTMLSFCNNLSQQGKHQTMLIFIDEFYQEVFENRTQHTTLWQISELLKSFNDNHAARAEAVILFANHIKKSDKNADFVEAVWMALKCIDLPEYFIGAIESLIEKKHSEFMVVSNELFNGLMQLSEQQMFAMGGYFTENFDKFLDLYKFISAKNQLEILQTVKKNNAFHLKKTDNFASLIAETKFLSSFMLNELILYIKDIEHLIVFLNHNKIYTEAVFYDLNKSKNFKNMLLSIVLTSDDVLKLQKDLRPAAARVVMRLLDLPTMDADLEQQYFSSTINAKQLGETITHGPHETSFAIVKYKFGAPAKITAQEVVDLFTPMLRSDRWATDIKRAQYVLEKMDLSLLPKNGQTLRTLFELTPMREVIIKILGLNINVSYVQRGHTGSWTYEKPATAEVYLNKDIDAFCRNLGAIDQTKRALFLAYTDFSRFSGLQAETQKNNRNFWLETWAALLGSLKSDEYSIVIEALKNADMPIIDSYADFFQMRTFKPYIKDMKALMSSMPIQVNEISDWIAIFGGSSNEDIILHVAEKWHFADAFNNGDIVDNIKQILTNLNEKTRHFLRSYISNALQKINTVDNVATVLDYQSCGIQEKILILSNSNLEINYSNKVALIQKFSTQPQHQPDLIRALFSINIADKEFPHLQGENRMQEIRKQMLQEIVQLPTEWQKFALEGMWNVYDNNSGKSLIEINKTDVNELIQVFADHYRNTDSNRTEQSSKYEELALRHVLELNPDLLFGSRNSSNRITMAHILSVFEYCKQAPIPAEGSGESEKSEAIDYSSLQRRALEWMNTWGFLNTISYERLISILSSLHHTGNKDAMELLMTNLLFADPQFAKEYNLNQITGICNLLLENKQVNNICVSFVRGHLETLTLMQMAEVLDLAKADTPNDLLDIIARFRAIYAFLLSEENANVPENEKIQMEGWDMSDPISNPGICRALNNNKLSSSLVHESWKLATTKDSDRTKEVFKAAVQHAQWFGSSNAAATGETFYKKTSLLAYLERGGELKQNTESGRLSRAKQAATMTAETLQPGISKQKQQNVI